MGKKTIKKGDKFVNPVVDPITGIIAKINMIDMNTSLLYSFFLMLKME